LRGLAGGSTAFLLGGCASDLPDLPDVAGLSTISSTVSPQRQIGFDLSTGVPRAQFGDRVDKDRRLTPDHSGPRNWRHPITAETLRIFVRENRERNGVRIRYMTMNADGTALGRVFDHRPGQANDRYFNQ